MSNNKVIGGRSIGGQKRAPAFVDALLELFGDVAATQAFVDSLTGFFATGADAQATLELAIASGSVSEANARLIRDALLASTLQESFKTWLAIQTSDNIENELASSYIFTRI
jgi:hypothetical protein